MEVNIIAFFLQAGLCANGRRLASKADYSDSIPDKPIAHFLDL